MKEKIAVIVAHIDDAEIWAGGTLLKYVGKAVIKIFVLRCNDEARKKEASKSAAILKGEYCYLENDTLLYQTVAAFRPTIIITHCEFDSHPEHAEVFKMVHGVIPYFQIFEHIVPNVYCMETYNKICMPPYSIFQPNIYIDISSVWKEKMKLIEIFSSQPVSYWQNMVEGQNKMTGTQVGVSYAESFIQIPVMGVLRCCDAYLKGND